MRKACINIKRRLSGGGKADRFWRAFQCPFSSRSDSRAVEVGRGYLRHLSHTAGWRARRYARVASRRARSLAREESRQQDVLNAHRTDDCCEEEQVCAPSITGLTRPPRATCPLSSTTCSSVRKGQMGFPTMVLPCCFHLLSHAKSTIFLSEIFDSEIGTLKEKA